MKQIDQYQEQNQFLPRYSQYPSGQIAVSISLLKHKQRIIDELEACGVYKYVFWTREGRYLPSVIHENEHIGGVVYGWHKDGYAMLVATDRRVVFLDRKPLFTNEDEIDYNVVSGVDLSCASIFCTLTLHTKIKDYAIRTINRKSAQHFVDFIETRHLEHLREGDRR